MCFGVDTRQRLDRQQGGFIAGSPQPQSALLFLFLFCVSYVSYSRSTRDFAGFCACLFSGEGPLLTHVECGTGGAPGMFFRWRIRFYCGASDAPSCRVSAAVPDYFVFSDTTLPRAPFCWWTRLFFAAHEAARLAVLVRVHGPHVCVCFQSTRLRVRTFGGLKTFCCSGEGFVMRFQGTPIACACASLPLLTLVSNTSSGPCTVFTQSRDPSILRPPEDKQSTRWRVRATAGHLKPLERCGAERFDAM